MNILNDSKRVRLDRIQSIFKMQELGKKNREIAKICRCSPSTVSETLNKYKYKDIDSWDYMNSYEKAKYVYDKQKLALKSRRHHKGHIPNRIKKDYVIDKLVKKGWSPEIISQKIQEEKGVSVSANTIYRFIKKNRKDLKKYLWEKGKKREQRVSSRRSTLKRRPREEKKYIDQRPESINCRLDFGHWEGDLVVGPKSGSKYVLFTIVERKTRYKKVIRIHDRKAETVYAHLLAFLMSLPPKARKSITLDNGGEFSPFTMHKLEKKLTNFSVYYTNTYSPQEKGSNEHFNGRLRKYFPKKTDFAYVPKEHLKLVVDNINKRPMKLLGYKSPLEAFNQETQPTTDLLAA